ncbi:RNase adapter RapZ [Caldisericum sp. AR60]|uniref:RNase adapter RapZ n=1 Tax=Caldisericum sp. AR60 TaxID=3397852 RepID=UPI0039FDA34C
MNFVIITGLSGAGKTKTVGVMEDLGYYCIDNLPPTLINDFIKIAQSTEGKINKICAVIDIRSKDFLKQFPQIVRELKKREDINIKIIFLEASVETLVKRFSETRRKHPFDETTSVTLEEKIKEEMNCLMPIKEMADIVLDTSNFKVQDLKRKIIEILTLPKEKALHITIITFGYKYGVPLQSDLVFDLRFIPNPFYEEELTLKSGLNKEVQDFVLSFDETKEFLNKLMDFLLFLIPYYIKEGKSYLTISLGCTGGHHRSVAVGKILSLKLKEKGFNVSVVHRDLENEDRK